MGAAGDMLIAALYELLGEKEKEFFLEKMNSLLPGVQVLAEPAKRQGIAGTHMRVVIRGEEEGHEHHHHHDHDHHHEHHAHDHDHHHDHDHEHGHDHHHHDHHHDHVHHHHEHRGVGDIFAIIDGFDLPERVKEKAKTAYHLIAHAESKAHGVPVGEVHFHEVGALDAVVDVTGVCYLMELLSPDAVVASTVTVGSGTVRTAHGLLPVPAPATAHLLEGAPITTGDIAAELCTPTGAALIKTFAHSFGPMPAGQLLGSGYGCGTKDFPRANCLRAFLVDQTTQPGGPNDAVTELRANMDDMSGEDLGFAMEKLMEAGALDVSYLPLQMKKNRPGVLLLCLCRGEDADRLAVEILRHTTTFGVRRVDCSRYALAVDPNPPAVETEYGTIRRKAGMGYGISKCKPEYVDLATAAEKYSVPISEVRAAFENS